MVLVFRQKFQGDAAPEPGVLGFVDNAHAAAAKFTENFVVADALFFHWIGRGKMLSVQRMVVN
jgi:hypothetical protein